MPSIIQIKQKLAVFLDGSISGEDFSEWLAEHGRDIHLTSLPAAQELVYSINLALDERSIGISTEDEMRAILRSCLTGFRVFVEPEPSWSRLEGPWLVVQTHLRA